MKSKKIIIWLIVALIILGILLGVILHLRDGIKLVSVKSEKELMSIYEGRTETRNDILLGLVTMPFSFMPYGIISPLDPWEDYYETEGPFDGIATNSPTTSNSSSLWDRTQLNGSNSTETSEKEHSTTNIQVENVDEADITKTDGNYIYSISGASVVITNVKDPANIKMEAVITPTDDYVPEDLIL